MDLYLKTCLECSKLITKRYSTSFSMGIWALASKFHTPIYAIYGFVRFADEIVDTFHTHDKRELFENFKIETYKAIETGISTNPVLHAFQWTVNTYHIEPALIDAFLKSMEMDLFKTSYSTQGYEEYIFGSAEVVGLMCLRVFCEGNAAQYNSLVYAAKKLGAAFQKVNFLRDIQSDFQDRGRVYFPGADFNHFTENQKRQIEADIEADFKEAYQGIINLPAGARGGVQLAYTYYKTLFSKIKKAKPELILTNRVRVPDYIKMLLLVKTMIASRV